MGQTPKTFDDAIEKLRKGDGKGIAVDRDGMIGPVQPHVTEGQGGIEATPTQKVVWGGGNRQLGKGARSTVVDLRERLLQIPSDVPAVPQNSYLFPVPKQQPTQTPTKDLIWGCLLC